MASFDRIYLLGIGGIGMSALARYFLQIGKEVAGYDIRESDITLELEKEGAKIVFSDAVEALPKAYQDTSRTLIIRTPAIPAWHPQLLFFQHGDFALHKRAEILGVISRRHKCLAVAGTHGKTTTSCLLAHLLAHSTVSFNAFLGGISSNFGSNYVANEDAEYTIIEADEFDRSFLHLRPHMSIITSADPDHLDIYGDASRFEEGFKEYVRCIDADGYLVQHKDLHFDFPENRASYSLMKGDFWAENIEVHDGHFYFDFRSKNHKWKNLQLGLPGLHNIENALACIAICLQLGMNEYDVRRALKSFKGVRRRFDRHINSEKLVYIDDYAHHPTAIDALVGSVRRLYPERKIIGVFQPHLFTRTRDFMDEFARSLSKLDECILLPIYPAREEAIPGITSETLKDKMSLEATRVVPKQDLLQDLQLENGDVLLTIGAGDIDRFVEPLKKHFG